MNVEAVIFTALKGLVGNRCYPSTFPQVAPGATQWPAIRYTVISTEPVEDITGTDLGETDDTRVQIDCVAFTYGAALTLRDQARAAMQGLDPPAVRVSGLAQYDNETKTHTCIDDYLFCASSPTGSP